MTFQASDYAIWMVFILLETLAFRFANKPEQKPLRTFMGMCLMRDFVLLAWSCHQKYYFAIIWPCLFIEWVWLEWIAAHMLGKSRAWRVFPFMVAAICLHYVWSEGWPIKATPEQLFHLERNMSLIVLGTLLIGGFLIFQRAQLRLAVAVAILAGSDFVSGQSYLMGNYSPLLASLIWAGGLIVLLADLKGCAGPLSDQQPLPCKPMSGKAGSLLFRQPPEEPASMPICESLPEPEWLFSKVPSQLQ